MRARSPSKGPSGMARAPGLHVHAERRLRRRAAEARHRPAHRGAAARDGEARRLASPCWSTICAAQGYEKPTIDDLVRAGHHGVERPTSCTAWASSATGRHSAGAHQHARPRRYAGLRAGSDGAGASEAVGRGSGASARPWRDARLRPARCASLGYGSVGVDGLVNARDHGVDADYVDRHEDLGFTKLPLDEPRAWPATTASRRTTSRAWPTSASRSLRLNAGQRCAITASRPTTRGTARPRLPPGDPRSRVGPQDHGVTPDYVKELKSLGYDQLSIDELASCATTA